MLSNLFSTRSSLAAQKAYELANVYRENAHTTQDRELAVVLCDNAAISLSRMKKSEKKVLLHPPLREHESRKKLRENIVDLYLDIAKLLESLNEEAMAAIQFKNAEKWGGPVYDPNHTHSAKDPASATALANDEGGPVSLASLAPRKKNRDVATIPPEIFQENQRPPAASYKFPDADERVTSTPQLGYLLTLLQFAGLPEEFSDKIAKEWVERTAKDNDEKERLKTMAVELVRMFTRDELKDNKAVSEVLYLAPGLEKSEFRFLLNLFHEGIRQSGLLDYHQLEGLAQLMRYAGTDYLEADDLVKILKHLSTRLIDTHQQSDNHVYRLTLALSNVLDAMADAKVKGLDRKTLHEPLRAYLDGQRQSSDPYLVYQSAYAYQALLFVPDNESAWQATMRRTGKVIQGVAGLVSAVKGLDLNEFVGSLQSIGQGLEGVVQVVEIVKDAYEGVTSLVESGQGFMESLKEGLSFDRRRDWYPGLRALDALLRDGQLATFKEAVCAAPCRRDPAFQWGVCQRLGELAANTTWPIDIRRNAMAFLVQIYKDDVKWGQSVQIKQWIIDILMQLSIISGPGNLMQAAESMMEELERDGDEKKQAMYQACREKGPSPYPLKVAMPDIGSPSLLDRVQNKPDVEGSLRLLKKRRLGSSYKSNDKDKDKDKSKKEDDDDVYIPPQGKENPQARDDTMFPLMEKIEEFLASERTVFLLMGDSGAGKSTFNTELEKELLRKYAKGGIVPLFISLPAIDKPEHDMIAKQLRKSEFTEPEIRELKYYREFILICDGYDESQQTQNLYVANKLNQQSEWKAKMIISCRSEYLGSDYRDRFQPTDRNRQSGSGSELFQQAVIAPFTQDQIQDYIKKYATPSKPWNAKDYQAALDMIPSLKELVSNPFLLSLSLEVLPRMVDPGQNLSSAKITKVGLYDQFVEQWLERGKKRLGDKDLSPQAKAAFDGLTDEGFAQNGIDFLKRLAVDIYKYQGGQPVVEYSRFKDEGTWKDYYFSRDDEKQILREACPLKRNLNQHRFIHRSLLEYCLSRAVFEPQEKRKKQTQAANTGRRGSVASVQSFEMPNGVVPFIPTPAGKATPAPLAPQKAPELKSPLIWRSFVKEPSVIQFLSERAQQEPVFKQQLLEYIEKSKVLPGTKEEPNPKSPTWSKDDPSARLSPKPKDDPNSERIRSKFRTAAANAITILVRAGHQFNEADLRYIQIPGADLSHGVFDSAQLQGADMRKVKFRNIWLRQANLDEARMAGTQFGELPYLSDNSAVLSFSYSADGRRCALGLENGVVSIYNTNNWGEPHHLIAHSAQVTQTAFSPRGRLIASGSLDNTVRVWDAESRACCFVLSGYSGALGVIAFSPQETQIAIVCDDKDGKSVKIWDEETGTFIRSLSGHSEDISSLAYSPKGDRLVTGSLDMTARVWEVETGKCLQILNGHTKGIRSVAYSPAGDQVVTGSMDKTARIWSVETGKTLFTLSDHVGEVAFVVYSPAGDRLATATDDSKDAAVRLWLPDGTCRQVLRGHTKEIKSLTFSPKGNQLASGSADRTVKLWDVESGNCDRTLSGHLDAVMTVVYAQTGQQIASGSLDQTVRLWDIEKSAGRNTSGGHSDRVTVVAYSPNVEHVVSCSIDKTVRVWERDTGSCRFTFTEHEKAVICASFSPQGHLIATGSEDKTVRLWDIQKGACDKVLSDHTDKVTTVVFSPTGDLVASGSADKTVRIWDVTSGACLHTLNSHTGSIRSIVFSTNGDWIITASDDGDRTIRVWSVESGESVHTLTGHEGSIQSVVCSPKDDQIASSSSDKTIRLWDLTSGENIRTLTGNHTDAVSNVVYSPKGDVLASGSQDGTICLWDAAAGTCLQTLNAHLNKISKIVFSPKGDKIATAGFDQTVGVWDVSTGKCETVLRSFQKPVCTLEWQETQDEEPVQCLLTGSDDNSVRLWHVIPPTPGPAAQNTTVPTITDNGNSSNGSANHVSGPSSSLRVKLVWRTTFDELMVREATIQDVEGLNGLNRRLLKQRQARGIPQPLKSEQAWKRVVGMTKALGRLKTPGKGHRKVVSASSSMSSISSIVSSSGGFIPPSDPSPATPPTSGGAASSFSALAASNTTATNEASA